MATTSFNDLVGNVRDFYTPKPSVIVQRFKFNSRIRAKEESIAAYLAALRELSEYCEYRDTLSEMIRDRLVCGVNHDGIQRRLLAEKELKYDKAVELALAVEAAEKGSRDLKNGSVPSEQRTCNHTQASGRHPPEKRRDDRSNDRNPRQGIVCYRCGKDHLASVCTHKETVCRFCKKEGSFGSRL